MSIVYEFMNELEEIQDDKIRDFVAESLSKVPDYYASIDNYLDGTKLALSYSKTFLEVLDSDDYVSDIVISAIILQDITKYRIEHAEGEDFSYHVEDPMHPLSVRQELLSLAGIIGTEKFDDILRTVESSHGLNSPIPQVMPSMGDPVYIWILPFANQLAKKEIA